MDMAQINELINFINTYKFNVVKGGGYEIQAVDNFLEKIIDSIQNCQGNNFPITINLSDFDNMVITKKKLFANSTNYSAEEVNQLFKEINQNFGNIVQINTLFFR